MLPKSRHCKVRSSFSYHGHSPSRRIGSSTMIHVLLHWTRLLSLSAEYVTSFLSLRTLRPDCRHRTWSPFLTPFDWGSPSYLLSASLLDFLRTVGPIWRSGCLLIRDAPGSYVKIWYLPCSVQSLLTPISPERSRLLPPDLDRISNVW